MNESTGGKSAQLADDSSGLRRRRKTLGRGWRLLISNPAALLSASLLILVTLSALLAPYLAPYNPYATGTAAPLSPPTRDHPMGTDRLGRDMWSRMLYGARLSLPTGAAAVVLSMAAGSLIGLLTGFFGGGFDSIGSKVVDIWLGFPDLILALLIITVLGVGIENVVLAVGISGVPGFARIVRGSTLSVRENIYVEAARALGASNGRILYSHVLSNVRGPIIVLATLTIGRAILATSSLGFLGMGVQPPTAEWGTMLSENREFMRQAPWLMLFPGLTVFATVVAVNLLGDFLGELLDPRLRAR